MVAHGRSTPLTGPLRSVGRRVAKGVVGAAGDEGGRWSCVRFARSGVGEGQSAAGAAAVLSSERAVEPAWTEAASGGREGWFSYSG